LRQLAATLRIRIAAESGSGATSIAAGLAAPRGAPKLAAHRFDGSLRHD
jgi:hypothetical protein